MYDLGSLADPMMLTAIMVASYLLNHRVEISDLPRLIQTVHGALAGPNESIRSQDKPMPCVPIQQSIKPDFLICLEDGRKLRMLKQ